MPSTQNTQAPSWFYYTPQGTTDTRNGPVTVAQLKQMALQGMITSETFIENVNGRREKAGNVRGLEFANPVPIPPPPPATPPPVAPIPVSQSSQFCTGCGKPIVEGQVFCGYCGTKIGTIDTVNTTTIDQPQPTATFTSKVSNVVSTVVERTRPYFRKVYPLVEKYDSKRNRIIAACVIGCVILLGLGSMFAGSKTRAVCVQVNVPKGTYVNHGCDYTLYVNNKEHSRLPGGSSSSMQVFFLDLPVGKVELKGRIDYKNAFGVVSKTQSGFAFVKVPSKGEVRYNNGSKGSKDEVANVNKDLIDGVPEIVINMVGQTGWFD